jgi:N-methylhydantoinase B/oxoprolinase/acetone carboxylase alpha subunit
MVERMPPISARIGASRPAGESPGSLAALKARQESNLNSLEAQIVGANTTIAVIGHSVEQHRRGKTHPHWDYIIEKAEKLQRDAAAVLDDVRLAARTAQELDDASDGVENRCGVCGEPVDVDYTGPDGSKHLAEFVWEDENESIHITAHVECGIGADLPLA